MNRRCSSLSQLSLSRTRSSDGELSRTDGAQLLPPTAAEGWQALPPMSVERCGARAVHLCDGRIAVFGGSRLSGRLLHSSAEAYDGSTASWSALAPMSVARVNFVCSAIPDAGDGNASGGAQRVIVAGGELTPPAAGASSLAQTGVTEAVEVYDVSTNCWSPLPSLSVQRYGGGAASLGSGGLMLVFGGFGGRSAEGEAQKQRQKVGGFTGLALPSALRAQGGGTAATPGAPPPPAPPAPPPAPPPAAGMDAAADWGGGGGGVAAAPASTITQANAELAQFVSADVTSLIQPQISGLPPLFDDGGCMCCSETPGADSVRGQPLHSTELYDERIGAWTPAQPMKIARQNIGACALSLPLDRDSARRSGAEGTGTPRVVVLGGLVAGRAVASCEQLQLPADVGGDEALAMLVGQAEWTVMEPALPEPRSHCAAVAAWLVLPSAAPEPAHLAPAEEPPPVEPEPEPER
jgi:hypothetical protein